MQSRPERVARTAPLAGLLLGSIDFVWIKYVPYPLGDLGNSSAIWALAAFVFAYWVRSGWLWSTVGAVGALVIAVPSYYLAAALIQGDDLSVLWAPTSIVWMCFGILAGLVFGTAGTWAREHGWRPVVGVALPGAVLFAEAMLLVRLTGHPDYGAEPPVLAATRAVLGVLVVVLASRTNRQRLLAMATAVPLALAGFGAFLAAGFR
ncbi:DUF6518 family protein [Micromonospora psammae]|uniref:DUF6518 family protein n=1 Tax=Micromonospora sp. CPCC 205556 TaxID=3122398 RepID=UPI002FF08D36